VGDFDSGESLASATLTGVVESAESRVRRATWRLIARTEHARLASADRISTVPLVDRTSRSAGWVSLQRRVKRLMDVMGAALGLVVLAPLFVVIAVAIKLGSPGPVFYRWHVVGRDGKFFVGHKFRTMVVDADAQKAQLLASNEMRGPVFKMAHDPRITAVGRLLRRHSLDELPQLWDVLRAKMSLVGPRPPLQSEWMLFDERQRHKLDVTPGLTCLWQVSGRNRIVDFDEWVDLDLKYINEWSLWLDIQILARTVFTVIRGTGK
jgi:lipopolysaccharide/colanic/teichoic acid biosynthesis glycosyltransferase